MNAWRNTMKRSKAGNVAYKNGKTRTFTKSSSRIKAGFIFVRTSRGTIHTIHCGEKRIEVAMTITISANVSSTILAFNFTNSKEKIRIANEMRANEVGFKENLD